jgi:hypothetical protein
LASKLRIDITHVDNREGFLKMVIGLLFLSVQLYAVDSVYTFFPKAQEEKLSYQKIRYQQSDTIGNGIDTVENESFEFVTSYDTNKATLLLSIHENGFGFRSHGIENIDTIYSDTCSESVTGDNLQCKGDARNYTPTTKFFSTSSKYLFIDPGWPLIDPHWVKTWYYDLNDSIYLYSEISNPSTHSTSRGYHSLEYCLNNIGLIYFKYTETFVPLTEEYVLVKINDLSFPVLDESRLTNSSRIDAIIPKHLSNKVRNHKTFFNQFILKQYILGRKLSRN